ncbi:MAG: sodium-translocating pyrophosphatase, partial [Candidatus Bathyarchaeia archaeon]
MLEWLNMTFISGFISLGLAGYLYKYILKQDPGTERMREIASAIETGARAYLKRQFMTLAIFVALMAVIVGTLYTIYQQGDVFFGASMSLSYVLGSICSAITAYVGMIAAVKANVRTANAARVGLKKAFPTAFYGGAIMGLIVAGLCLLGVSAIFYLYRFIIGFSDELASKIVLGFSFGVSSLALFARAGGGIYTKTADISADLVGKVELNIPEDDPRNPAVIADNVGDNVGDVAGMGADLADSYVASIVAAMILGVAFRESIFIMFPLIISTMGLFASILGVLITRASLRGSPGAALNKGSFGTWIIFTVLLFLAAYYSGLEGSKWLGVFLPAVAGLVVGIVIGLTTDYFTSIDRKPAKKVAEASITGAAINILTGFSYGVISIVPPIIGICAATLAAWYLSTLFGVNPFYGVAISAVGMLATVGITISADAYGPISDNAKGIAEQSWLGEEVIDVADKLDAAGNTTKAITKGFAIGSAALTVLALFLTYIQLLNIRLEELTLMKPQVVAGIFLGAMMPPLFSALVILAVGRNAWRMINEIRRQFKEIP